ncbi:MAG: hypothetical protein EXR35_08460 [Limnohabitans sp.]|nr:hypothetical protein [Limnohabitans sp.]
MFFYHSKGLSYAKKRLIKTRADCVQAVAEGERQGDGWLYKEHEFMFPNKVASFSQDATQSQKILSNLDSFGSVETRF